MNVYSRVPGYARLPSIPVLSKKARQRLKWFDYYKSHNQNARLTCRYFGISPQTFYRWKRRYDPYHLERLEDRPCRPHRVRQPTYSPELVAAVLRLREKYPRWGKDKLVILLRRDGLTSSASTVGRILNRLKQQGVLKEPLPNHISARKRQRQRPYAVRKPKEYQSKEPGDIVEVPIKAIQVDGGSEFQDAFERECQRRGIRLFILPPRSPKLNGHVERAQRTHTEEFYEVTDANFNTPELNQALLKWENVYNTIRPYQALGYFTPQEFLKLHQDNKRKEEVSLRY
jgi:transposase InsO family protein